MNKINTYLVFYFVTLLTASLAQSPHGNKLSINCAVCHQPESWTYNALKSTFSHDSTSFPLYGQHTDLDCRSCHKEMVFEKASSDCISCHNDIHRQSVGNDCARCHNAGSWIVENITQLHEETAFPLIGVHQTMDCAACHMDETNLRFNVTGVDCISCHKTDFENTKNPNHIKLNFGEDCISCHSLNGSDWNTTEVDHSFFPLEKGHSSLTCNQCHSETQWGDLSSDCFSCHENDFNTTVLPNHKTAGFSNRCTECHTLDPGWKPAQFKNHDSDHFPVYSGSHQGVWNDCRECHTNTDDFKQFTCISCHKNPETDNFHDGIGGYTYTDISCLGCHPTGNTDNAFDHNSTSFPLTGAHVSTGCIECHADGFEGTSTACVDCHLVHYNESQNPNHSNLGLSTDCASCHSTAPGWSPATFEIHDQYYALNGAHKTIANQCNQCHVGNYNNTPNTCAGCHTPDFTEAKNPDHVLNQFSNECTICHDETAWRPSTFNHDALYFPIYTGKHAGAWDQCTDCHLVAGDFKAFSCITCHVDPITSEVHTGVQGYIFQDNACLACHPTGDADVTFDHNNTAFPLTGAHQSANCFECHSNGFSGTPTECIACHNADRNESLNPNHLALSLGDDCSRCHSAQPGWAPANFPDHNNYYALNGSHQIIAENCFS